MDLLAEMASKEHNSNTVKINLRGRLDTVGVHHIESEFAEEANTHNILVDLSEVTYMASMGIRMLISKARALAGSGKKMVLVGAPELVQETLESAGVDQIVPIAADAADAESKLHD